MPTNRSLFNHQGFTLLEILIAMVLMAVALSLSVGMIQSYDPHKKIEESLDYIERAVRFGVDEAVIRNKIIRLRFIMNEAPHQFLMEYGPDDSFVIPLSQMEVGNISAEDESDEEKEARKKFNQNFSRIDEFAEENYEFHESVKILGIGSGLQKTLISELEGSFYIYPSGEKDPTLIILAIGEEIATLKIEPYTLEMDREYEIIKEDGDLEDLYEAKAQEKFKSWLQ